MEPNLADSAEGLDSEPGERPAGRARTVARILGFAVVGLGTMALSAGSAWWIRGYREGHSAAPGRHAGSEPIAQPDRTTARLKTGRLAYQVHCARCHGPEGRGDGADSAVLRPPPRDFSARPWTHGESAEAIRSVVLRGVPGTSMTGWGHLLSSQQLDAVVDYVRTLGSPSGKADAGAPPKMLLHQAGFEPVDPPITAPAITFQDLSGRDHALDQDLGKGILLVFWGTTCAPCVEELPALDRLAAEFGDAGLAVRPICVDEPDEALVREIARTQAQNLPLFVDRSGLARLRYNVQTLPCSVLIDREGRLLGRSQGGRDWSSKAVQAALHAIATGPGDPD